MKINHFDDSLHSLVWKYSDVDLLEEKNDLLNLRNILAFYFRIEQILSRQLHCEHHEDKKRGCWTNMPLGNDRFLKGLERIKKFKVKTFLDVGCGFGMKCWLACRFGLEATGIDLCRNYVDFSRQIFKIWGNWDDLPKKPKIRCVDALKYRSYGNYDLIYMYHPIRDDCLMQKLVDRVVRQMKVGSFLFAVLFGSVMIPENLKEIDWDLWQKKK